MVATSHLSERGRSRTIRTVLMRVALVLACGLLTGMIYERVGEKRDQDRFPRVGRAVDIGGRSLNIYCSGEGSPSVILDTGGTNPGYSNLPFQELIAKETRACWFDRAGLGWSDPSPVTQTSAAIAADLHALLHAAKVEPPYILVGQSFSGFNVRVFAGTYAKEVGGVVLLDSVHEDQQRYEPRSTYGLVNRLPAAVRGLVCTAVPFAARAGLLRLLMSASGPSRRIPSGFTASQAATLHGLEVQPKAMVAAVGCRVWERSADEARAAGSLGDTPLIVLTAGKPLTTGDSVADRELLAFHEIWVHQLQRKLAGLSTRGKQVIVENSSHGIAGDMPTAAVGAIRQVLSEIRGR
jgi:pimeloyl-ACP methyl ester carboxylesterase